ncbi:MAG: hypothetical protein P4L33_17375 [Capsulimonadaceae bacterium]|nr:hypothetical protein [Capsulimonadaceae bacterium]
MEISPQNDGRNSGRVSAREVELIRFRDGKVPVKFQLMTDEILEGVVLWYDDLSVHIVRPDQSEVTIMFNVISTYGRR